MFFLTFLILFAFAAEDPDVGLNHTEIVKRYGYEIEAHEVHTIDGYILTMFHMPPKVPRPNVYPILFQHALLDSSWSSVANPAPNSLAYVLVDAGFDVWFGNNRGNWYSDKHETLTIKDKAFWNFTYDDMADKDLPAELHYVLQKSGAAKVNYMGHSEGTLQCFAQLSQDEKTAEMINFAIMLGPVAYIEHLSSPIFLAMGYGHIDQILSALGVHDFMGHGALNKLGDKLCKRLETPCDIALELFCGKTQQINETRLPVFLSETPAGTSMKNMDHWAQGLREGGFQKYDYGKKGNMAQYGQETPPHYNLTKITTPIALLSGDHDSLADPKDVKRLKEELSNVIFHREYVGYAHLDFTWGMNTTRDLYPDILMLLGEHGRIVVD